MARITIEDVAAASGVSVTTVSHVFSGHRPVSEETQRLVREVAHRMGYRPNAVARSLRSQRTHTIMIVVPDITNGFYPEYARGVQDAVATAGYHCVLSNTDGIESEERAALEEAIARRLDGLVFIGFRVPPTDLIPLAESGIAIVNIGDSPGAGPIDSVRFDDTGAMAEGTSFLLDRYGTSIALISGDDDFPVGRERRRGFVAACRRAGVPEKQIPIVETDFTRSGGVAGMTALLDRSAPPRAVMCANDMIALGAIDVAKERGLRVPDDVAIMGYDDIDAATIVTPRLTTIHTNAKRLGTAAGQFLLERMSGARTGDGRHAVIDHRLVVRESA